MANEQVPLLDLRLRSQISAEELESKVGKIVNESDYNVLLTGPARVRKPDGTLLAVYVPGALRDALDRNPETYGILHSMRSIVTDNRGYASGSPRIRYENDGRTRTKRVRSVIAGAFDPSGPVQFCRMTSWTHKNMPKWQAMFPFFQAIDRTFQQYVPDRHAAQMAHANATESNWLIPGTAFTTITVNNTYPTGVHTDKGDLDAGFSTLAVLRRGDYSGGTLVIPKYRIAVDLADGDLILFDAHEFHGNTAIHTHSADAERISVVSYFRAGMVSCGSVDEELAKARVVAERRGGLLDDGTGTATG